MGSRSCLGEVQQMVQEEQSRARRSHRVLDPGLCTDDCRCWGRMGPAGTAECEGAAEGCLSGHAPLAGHTPIQLLPSLRGRDGMEEWGAVLLPSVGAPGMPAFPVPCTGATCRLHFSHEEPGAGLPDTAVLAFSPAAFITLPLCQPPATFAQLLLGRELSKGLPCSQQDLGEACPSVSAWLEHLQCCPLCPTAAAPIMYSSQDALLRLQYNYWRLLHH